MVNRIWYYHVLSVSGFGADSEVLGGGCLVTQYCRDHWSSLQITQLQSKIQLQSFYCRFCGCEMVISSALFVESRGSKSVQIPSHLGFAEDVGAFEFPTPPARETLELALEELYALGAIDAEARLAEPLGLRMAHGPLPAPLMRLLLLSVEAGLLGSNF